MREIYVLKEITPESKMAKFSLFFALVMVVLTLRS